MEQKFMTNFGDVTREIYKGKNASFVVLSRFLATREYDQPFVNISITDPDKEKIDFPLTENRKDVLQISFYDVEADDKTFFPITKDDAKKIAEFALKHKDKLIVVNCEAGLCRSAGIAAALSYYLNGTDKFFFNVYLPNKTVYRAILNAIADSLFLALSQKSQVKIYKRRQEPKITSQDL